MLSEYVGEYQLNEFNERNEFIAQTKIDIALKAGQLYVTPAGESKAALFPTEKDHLFVRIAPVEFLFNRDEDAEVAGFTLVQRGQRINAPKLR